jgi:hypothetical protein
MSVVRFDPFRDFDRLAEQMFSAGLRGTPRSVPMDATSAGTGSSSISICPESTPTRSN